MTQNDGAAIAQPVEHVIRNDGVGGSSPSCGTTNIKGLMAGFPVGWPTVTRVAVHLLSTRKGKYAITRAARARGQIGAASAAWLGSRRVGAAVTVAILVRHDNYRPGAPTVERIGGGGFWMTGTVAARVMGRHSRANASKSGRTRLRDTRTTNAVMGPRSPRDPEARHLRNQETLSCAAITYALF